LRAGEIQPRVAGQHSLVAVHRLVRNRRANRDIFQRGWVNDHRHQLTATQQQQQAALGRHRFQHLFHHCVQQIVCAEDAI
jgi:hypothetical protein